jgi:ABC-type protease/lipase transport system fused ATPase/permease subunit
VVIVSHRRSLIAQLDRIAILRNGKIEAFGPSSLVLGRVGEAAKVLPFPSEPQQVSA